MPLLSALLVAAQALTLPAPSSRVCTAIDVVDPVQERLSRKRVFSARETVDLELRARLHPRVSGDHLLRLKLYTPGGFLYQEMTVPFRPDSAKRRRGRAAGDETTQVVPVRASRAGRRFGQVTVRLPVAGSSITLGSLYGRWTAVPYLDDEAAPCGRSRRFVIRR